MASTLSLGPFDLVHPLGHGGLGEVWAAVHRAQSVPVAVKVLTGELSRRKHFRRLFQDEVRAVAALDHPGIVLVLDYGEIGPEIEASSEGRLVAGSPWLAMELASGGSLDHQPLPASWAELRGTLLSLLDALAHAHARGVVHRDLKPANLLLCTAADPRPGLKLADFGIAHVFDEAPEVGAICGTPLYMAPEQFAGDWRSFGPWTDLYGFGCVAWELATGRPPFEADEPAALGEMHRSTPLPRLEPTMAVPAGFEGWLATLLLKASELRPHRAADVAAALLRLGDASGGTARPPRSTSPTLARLWDTDAMTEVHPGFGGPASGEAIRIQPALPPPPVPRSWRADAVPTPMRLVGAGLGLFGLRELGVVGRESERDRLWAALVDVVRTRRARTIILRGGRGSGKGRLARWLGERADELGVADALRTRHHAEPDALDGLPRMMARQLRIGELRGPAIDARVGFALRELGLDDPAMTRSYAAIAASGVGDPADRPRPTATERHGLVARWIKLRARIRPIVWWVDDAQWGADTLDAVRWLLTEAADTAVLVVVVVADEILADRPAETDALARLGALAESWDVDPLPAADLAAFARDRLGLDAGLAQKVAERADGNPMFAIQLVRDWVDRGVLVVGRDGFVLARGARAGLPDDLHVLWDDRIAAAIAAAGGGREALEIAAVLGSDVDVTEWTAACRVAGVRRPEGLIDALLVRRLARPHEGGLTFAHRLLGESLLRSAVDADRLARWHLACADALVSLGSKLLSGRIGRHELAGGRPDRAVPFLLEGAQLADRREEVQESVPLLDAAERAMNAAHWPASAVERGVVGNLRATILTRHGRVAEAWTRTLEVEEAARTHGWTEVQTRASRLLATIAVLRGDAAEGDRWAARALALAEERGDRVGRSAALNVLADVARMRGDWRTAGERYAQAANVASHLENVQLAEALQGMALHALHTGDFAGARDLYERSLELGQRLESRNLIGNAWNGLGEVARREDRLDEADRCYREAVRALSLIGAMRTVVVRMNLAIVLLRRDRPDEAAELLTPALQLLVARGRKAMEAFCEAILAAGAAGRDPAGFDAHLGRCTELVAALGIADEDAAWCLEEAARRWAPVDPARAAAASVAAADQRRRMQG